MSTTWPPKAPARIATDGGFSVWEVNRLAEAVIALTDFAAGQQPAPRTRFSSALIEALASQALRVRCTALRRSISRGLPVGGSMLR